MLKNCPSCGNVPHSQDALHGKGIRVFNQTTKGLRCTVCTREVINSKPTDLKKK